MYRNNSGVFAALAALFSILASGLLIWSLLRSPRSTPQILVLPAPVTVVAPPPITIVAPPVVKVITPPVVIVTPPTLPAPPLPPKTTPPRKTPPPPPAAALPVIVSKTGLDKYSTLRDAVAHEPEGTRIRIRAGVYQESVALDKTFEIARMEGEPAGSVIVQSDDAPCISFVAGDAIVQGLSLRGRGAGSSSEPAPTQTSAGKPAPYRAVVENTGGKTEPPQLRHNERNS